MAAAKKCELEPTYVMRWVLTRVGAKYIPKLGWCHTLPALPLDRPVSSIMHS